MSVDIVGYLESQGLYINYSGENVGSNDVAIQCPWCDDPSTHLTIHRSDGRLNCWRCEFSEYIARHPKGWRPSFKALIKEIEDIPWSEVKRRWEEIGGEDVSYDLSSIYPRQEKCYLPDGTRLFSDPGPFKGQRDFAYKYLLNRGFTRYHIDRYKFHFCPIGKYQDRIIIPIYKNNVLVNWVGRRYNPNMKWRYRNCKLPDCVVRLNEMLYGEEEWEGNVLRLVEGIFDKIKIGNTALAINRSSISSIQKRMIIDLSKKADYASIILDPEAYWSAYRIAEEISPFISRVRVVKLPKNTDPASIPAEMLVEIEKSTNFATF